MNPSVLIPGYAVWWGSSYFTGPLDIPIRQSSSVSNNSPPSERSNGSFEKHRTSFRLKQGRVPEEMEVRVIRTRTMKQRREEMKVILFALGQ